MIQLENKTKIRQFFKAKNLSIFELFDEVVDSFLVFVSAWQIKTVCLSEVSFGVGGFDVVLPERELFPRHSSDVGDDDTNEDADQWSSENIQRMMKVVTDSSQCDPEGQTENSNLKEWSDSLHKWSDNVHFLVVGIWETVESQLELNDKTEPRTESGNDNLEIDDDVGRTVETEGWVTRHEGQASLANHLKIFFMNKH